MKNSKHSFKAHASAIIGSCPHSMKDFLADKPPSVETQPLETDNTQDDHGVTRIHVHIRQELADKLLEAVFERKMNKGILKKEASQRAIIEEALDRYFG